MNAKKSHRALLEIIQEKERDLNRIRQVADSAAEDEMINGQRQLQQLQSDYGRSNDTIKSLQQYIHDLEEEHMQSIQSVERKCKEAAEEHIAKMGAKSEDEQRKRLRNEFDERLASKERDLEKVYQISVVEELRNQERKMHEQFDRLMSDGEHQHTQEVVELQKMIQAKDAEISEHIRLNEKEQDDREAHFRREAREECNAEVRSQLEVCERRFQASISILEEEKDQFMRDLHQFKQGKSRSELENRELRCKIEELLSVLQNLESEYMATVDSMASRKTSMEARINELQCKISSLDASLRNAEDEYSRQLKAIEKRCRAEKKTLDHTIKKLKQELEAAKDEKEDIEETVKEKESEAKNCKLQLKEKVSVLKRECKSLRQEIDAIHGKATAERRYGSAHKEGIEQALFDKERESTIARQRLLQQFEDTMKRDKEAFAEEKLHLVRERDDTRIEKEAAVHALEKKRMDYESLRVELSSLRQRQQTDIEAYIENNQELKVSNGTSREENLQLKESIRAMRSEMERLMASSSEVERSQVKSSVPLSHSSRYSQRQFQSSELHSSVHQQSLNDQREGRYV